MRTHDQKSIALPANDRLNRMGVECCTPSPGRRLWVPTFFLVLLAQLVAASIAHGSPQDKPQSPPSETVKPKAKAPKKKDVRKTVKRGRSAEAPLQEIKRSRDAAYGVRVFARQPDRSIHRVGS